VYVRKMLSERWNCFPWDVDDAPADEVALELRLAAIELECERKS
jgi:hypothetical protein